MPRASPNRDQLPPRERTPPNTQAIKLEFAKLSAEYAAERAEKVKIERDGQWDRFDAMQKNE